MDLLARFLGGSLHATSKGPADDFWYQPVGTVTPSGLRVDADGAQKVSAWFRGRDILATALAMLPLPVYRRLEDGGREPVSITLWDVVGRKPNTWQDSFGWRRQAMYHLIDHGNAYSRIVAGARGFLDQLWPIHPTRVTPEQLDSGRVIYHVRHPKTGQITRYTQDEMFHLRSLSDDGVIGSGILEHARNSVGLALTIETYASTLFGRGALHSGVINNPGLLDEEAGKRMAKSFITAIGNWHLPKVLEQGSTFTPASMSAEDAQMLLSREFSINDIARWLGVPSHMIGDLKRATFSNIEHQGQEFVTYSLGPWLTLWESAINDQLVIQTGTYYAEFVRDALVRGDIKTRWDAYMKAVQTGCFTRNEIRELENRNKLPGLDEPLDPAHLTGKAAASTTDEDDDPPTRERQDRRATRADGIAQAAAARLLRKEIAAVQKLAVRHASNADTFAGAVTEFYQAHVALVVSTLDLTDEQAREYCASQAAQVIAGEWTVALETWKTDHYAAGLAALALEEAA